MTERKYLVATDVGGTCTDSIVFAAGEPIRLGKSLSTPPDFAQGVIDSIRVAAESMKLTVPALLAKSKAWADYCDGERPLEGAIRKLAAGKR